MFTYLVEYKTSDGAVAHVEYTTNMSDTNIRQRLAMYLPDAAEVTEITLTAINESL